MATLAVAHTKHQTGSQYAPRLLAVTRPMLASDTQQVKRAVVTGLIGCGDGQFKGHVSPQMFVVEGVSPAGVYEWSYSCDADRYTHSSWMTCVSGGPPVVAGRVGLYSGLCSVSNLARLHSDDVPRLSISSSNNTRATRATHATAPRKASQLGAGGLETDWDARLETQLRPAATLDAHANFSGKPDDCDGDVDELQAAPEWWAQEEEAGVEAEARGGGEGSLWGQAPHLQTQVGGKAGRDSFSK
jgi:hypothetical protein